MQPASADYWRSVPLERNAGRLLHLCDIALGKNFFSSIQTIEGGWKTGINGHLYGDLHDFLARASHIARTVNVHFQLKCGLAQSGQRGNNADFFCGSCQDSCHKRC